MYRLGHPREAVPGGEVPGTWGSQLASLVMSIADLIRDVLACGTVEM